MTIKTGKVETRDGRECLGADGAVLERLAWHARRWGSRRRADYSARKREENPYTTGRRVACVEVTEGEGL
jgi:hypothetical protein